MKPKRIKHTPGPWRVEADGLRILRDFKPRARRYYDRIAEADRVEDAPLIAAGPDLLAALQAIVDRIGNSIHSTDQATGQTFWTAAIAAIDKATRAKSC